VVLSQAETFFYRVLIPGVDDTRAFGYQLQPIHRAGELSRIGNVFDQCDCVQGFTSFSISSQWSVDSEQWSVDSGQ
jgi:hypothetical protein